jgi:NAD(P)-dependent dehydrogenase (short-subunit alcohol dehydrogenase family)
MNSALENKVAIVTGAGSERGLAIALALAEAGARVAANDINPDRAQRTAAALRSEGYEALAITADVANRFQCVSLIEGTREQWGRIDILVNHAAVRPFAPILKMDEWAWQRCQDVNLKGAFFMSQLVGRVMVDENQERGGTIIHIGAAPVNDLPETGAAAYAASKGGLASFSDQCAREYAPHGIRVHFVQADPAVSEGKSAAVDNTDHGQDLADTIVSLCSLTKG